MKPEKLDSGLQLALEEEKGPFQVLVHFTHAVTHEQIAPLGLSAIGEMASGLATVERIGELTDRSDVVSVALMPRPSPS